MPAYQRLRRGDEIGEEMDLDDDNLDTLDEQQPALEQPILDAEDEDNGEGMESPADILKRMREARALGGKTDDTFITYIRQVTEMCEAAGMSKAVTSTKVVRFIRLLTTRPKKQQQRIKGSRRQRAAAGAAYETEETATGQETETTTAPPMHLHPQTILVAIASCVDLWNSQKYEPVEFNGKRYRRSKESPRTEEVKNVYQEYLDRWNEIRKAECRDPTSGTIAANGGRTQMDIGDVGRKLMAKNSHVADQARFDATLGAVTIGRGDEKRNLNLSNCVLVEVDGVGPSRCCARKNSRGSKNVSYLSALRHKDPWCCPFNAFDYYLIRRFLYDGEPFPNFIKGRYWYEIKALVSSFATASKEKAIEYSTEARQIANILKDQGIIAEAITHWFRKMGCENAEVMGDGYVSENQLVPVSKSSLHYFCLLFRVVGQKLTILVHSCRNKKVFGNFFFHFLHFNF